VRFANPVLAGNHQVRKLRVVDQRHRALMFRGVRELRTGEHRVHQHDVCTELGQDDKRIGHPAVVAAQQGNPVTGEHAFGGQAVSERVSKPMYLSVRGRTALIDDGDPVGAFNGRRGGAA
jgi:hypothetical protein